MKTTCAPIAILLAAMLAGYGSPSAAQPAATDAGHADYGRYPPDYKALVQAWSRSNIKAPDGLQFGHVSKPRREWAPGRTGTLYGWSVCAMITAPNSYGVYTGPQTFWFLIHDEQVVSLGQSDTISSGHRVNCSDGTAPSIG
jgi:hypothetical protein